MDKQQLISEVEDALNGFIDRFSLFSDEKINTPVAGKNWTAGELGQHVVLATQVFNGNNTQTADRPYDVWVNDIRDVFTNQENKAQSPPFVLPEKKKYQSSEIIDALRLHRDAHIENIKNKDLTLLVMDMALPVWAHLTIYEWIKLMIYHVQRHTQQLKEYA